MRLTLVLLITGICCTAVFAQQPAPRPADEAIGALNRAIETANADQDVVVESAQKQYKADLKTALDVAMKTANLNQANTIKAEADRVGTGANVEDATASDPAVLTARKKYHAAILKGDAARRHDVDLAQRKCVAALDVGIRSAMKAGDLDEANRIKGVEEKLKNSGDTNGSSDNPEKPLPMIDDSRVVDLLPLVLPTHDTIRGAWRFQGNTLITTEEENRIRLPYRPPDEYDFEVDFTVAKLLGWNDVNQLLSFQHHEFEWQLGGWHNTVYGFRGAGFDPDHQEVHSSNILQEKTAFQSIVQVRRNSVTALVNGTVFKTMQIDLDKITPEPRWAQCAGILGLYAADQIIYRKIQVTEKSGHGQIIGRISDKLIGQTKYILPSPVASTVSLVDLKPRVAEVGFAELLKNQLPDGNPDPVKTADGKRCTTYLFAHADSSIIYDIPVGAMGFQAIAMSQTGNKDINCAIYVDGNEALISKPMKDYPGHQIEVSLPLPAGSHQIELCMRGPWDHGWAIWAWPQFLFSTAKPQN